jgi:hypothetical protein
VNCSAVRVSSVGDWCNHLATKGMTVRVAVRHPDPARIAASFALIERVD